MCWTGALLNGSHKTLLGDWKRCILYACTYSCHVARTKTKVQGSCFGMMHKTVKVCITKSIVDESFWSETVWKIMQQVQVWVEVSISAQMCIYANIVSLKLCDHTCSLMIWSKNSTSRCLDTFWNLTLEITQLWPLSVWEPVVRDSQWLSAVAMRLPDRVFWGALWPRWIL